MQASCDVLAFYLPQFHPIPENDAWWGRGFTEWTNVVRAAPRFHGHYQPHLPTELGFYDLRVPEVRQVQAELAREHGITGFVYYHYWFGGRRVLERPFCEVLESGQPDFPFALCWANENWTRVWDGSANDVLLRQEHSAEDDAAHLAALVPAFEDERYVRVEGRPLFLVYRASLLPDVRRTADVWRKEARRHGVGEIFLARVDQQRSETLVAPDEQGFDAAVDWIPEYSQQGRPLRRNKLWGASRRLGLTSKAYAENNVVQYERVVANMLARPAPPYLRFPCVTVSWDNSPRRSTGAFILRGATPDQYEMWLEAAAREAMTLPPGRRLLFISAWNEWAEGNHLEPDERWGRAYLEATRDALARAGALHAG